MRLFTAYVDNQPVSEGVVFDTGVCVVRTLKPSSFASFDEMASKGTKAFNSFEEAVHTGAVVVWHRVQQGEPPVRDVILY